MILSQEDQSGTHSTLAEIARELNVPKQKMVSVAISKAGKYKGKCEVILL